MQPTAQHAGALTPPNGGRGARRVEPKDTIDMAPHSGHSRQGQVLCVWLPTRGTSDDD